MRRARDTAPTPDVSAMVCRRPYLRGMSKSSRVAPIPPTSIMLTAKSAPSRARRRSVVVVMRAWAPETSFVHRAIASAVARRSSTMSWSTISTSASSGNVRMSPSRLRVNSTLPAPMKTILVMARRRPFVRLRARAPCGVRMRRRSGLSDSVANDGK